MFFEKYAVRREYRNLELKVVEGEIPKGIRGVYYKNGPAWRSPIKHVLDGDGYLTAVRFNDGKAWLTSKYLVDTERKKGPNAFSGPMLSLEPLNNKSNTNVVWYDDKLLAFYEGGVPYVVDPVTLEVQGIFGKYKPGVPFKTALGFLKGGDAVNAHPKLCDSNMSMTVLDVKYHIGFGKLGSWLRFKEFCKGCEVKEVEVFVKDFVYLHDFAITPRYYVFIRHPLRISFEDMTKGIAVNLKQTSGACSTVFAADRATGDIIQTWQVPGDMFVTHFVAAKECAGLCLDIICYDGYDDVTKMKGNHREKLVCNKDGSVNRVDVLETLGLYMEFPNKGHATCGMSHHPMEGIVRLVDGKIVFREPCTVVGEPIKTDDGYIMFFAHRHDENWQDPGGSWLYVMSNSEVVCKIELPGNYLPLGLHGCWHKT